MGKTRESANLVSGYNIFSSITNNRVGIATSSPQYTFDITGDLNFTGNLNQGGSTFVASRWTSGTDDDIYRLNGDVSIGASLPTGTASQPLQVTGGAYVSGNLGVGFTNPAYKLDVNGSIRFGGTGNNEGILRSWSSLDVDVDSLLPGSTFGSIFEGANNGHIVIGIRDNDSNDSFSIIGGSGNYQTDTTYDSVIAYFGVDGDVGIGTNNPTSKLEVSGVIKDAGGNVRAIPNNDKTTSYTLTADDVGELINITTGGVTVPASVFSAGNSVTIYNNSASSQTITQGTSTTLRLAGTSTTGNRTLAQRGITTIMCVAANEFVISGAGLS